MPARSYPADDPARTMSPYTPRRDTMTYDGTFIGDPYRDAPATYQGGYRGEPGSSRGRADGDYRTGDYRTGDYRTGDYRTGDYRTGDYRTGDYRGDRPYEGDRDAYRGDRAYGRVPAPDAYRPAPYRGDRDGYQNDRDHRGGSDYRDRDERSSRDGRGRGREERGRGGRDRGRDRNGGGGRDSYRDDRGRDRDRGRGRGGRPGRAPSESHSPATRTPLLLRGSLAAALIVAVAASLVRAGLGTPATTHNGRATLVLGQGGASTAVQTLVPSPSVAAAAAKAPAAKTAAAKTAAAEAGCHVEYAITSRTAGHFTAVVAVANTGATAVSGWTLTWTYAPETRLTNGWNAIVDTAAGRERATSTAADRVIPAGASATIGFVGAAAGTTGAALPVPSAFSLNGVTCR